MSWNCYVNVEPHDVTATLTLEDGQTVYQGHGSQRVDFFLDDQFLPGAGVWGCLLTVSATGYTTFTQRLTLPPVGGAFPGVVLQPATPVLSKIHVNGFRFSDEQGHDWPYVGVSRFTLLADRILRGRDLVLQQLDELKRFGRSGLVLRIFRCAGPWNAFALVPQDHADYLDHLIGLVDDCASYGFYVDYTGGDYQAVMPNQADQQRHLDNCLEALQGRFGFFSSCNESFKNGMDTNIIRPRVPTEWRLDSGNYDNLPNGSMLDHQDYHPTRDEGGLTPWPKWLYEIAASAEINNTVKIPVVLKEPIGFDEVNQPGRRTNNSQFAGMMGWLGTRFCAGITAHIQAGVAGGFMGPAQRACLSAFLQGVEGKA